MTEKVYHIQKKSFSQKKAWTLLGRTQEVQGLWTVETHVSSMQHYSVLCTVHHWWITWWVDNMPAHVSAALTQEFLSILVINNKCNVKSIFNINY